MDVFPVLDESQLETLEHSSTVEDMKKWNGMIFWAKEFGNETVRTVLLANRPYRLINRSGSTNFLRAPSCGEIQLASISLSSLWCFFLFRDRIVSTSLKLHLPGSWTLYLALCRCEFHSGISFTLSSYSWEIFGGERPNMRKMLTQMTKSAQFIASNASLLNNKKNYISCGSYRLSVMILIRSFSVAQYRAEVMADSWRLQPSYWDMDLLFFDVWNSFVLSSCDESRMKR